jgi:3,4-dihydroxy 2-butanone 4-phosphate synthase/GTP cyclohydrolase II
MKYIRHIGSTAPKNPSRLNIMGRRLLEQSMRASKRDLFGYRCHSRSTITRAQISLSADHVNVNCKEPTPGFASIDQALIDIACGRLVVVLDDEDRENEGDLIGAADRMTQETLHFMIQHTSGLVCVALDDKAADRLNLPLTVSSIKNGDTMKTAFTVSCDHAESTTGISAGERAATICRLGATDARADEFVKPGHVFPLRARTGGVLTRNGHTEAAYDLSVLAGRGPAGVLCEVVNDSDGSMARLPELRTFSEKHGLKMILISDLIRYRQSVETKM